MPKTIEERVEALEQQMTDEAMVARINPIVAGLVAAHAGEIVKIGTGQIVSDIGSAIAAPFIWVGEQIGLCSSDEEEVETPKARTSKKSNKAKRRRVADEDPGLEPEPATV